MKWDKLISITVIILAILLGTVYAEAQPKAPKNPIVTIWTKYEMPIDSKSQLESRVSCISQNEAFVNIIMQKRGQWVASAAESLISLGFVVGPNKDKTKVTMVVMYIGKSEDIRDDLKKFIKYLKAKENITTIDEAKCPWKISQKKYL